MKLIEPSVELIKQESDIEGIYKQIERCARVCYKSENKITEDSAKKFVDMLIKNGHGAMLEHGTVYLKFHNTQEWVSEYSLEDSTYTGSRYHYDQYSKSQQINESEMVVTTNFRTLVERNVLDDLNFLCEPTEYHEKRYTLKFTTSIGITRELVRHRHFSFANESTRYCNYSKDKFGGEITFIIPYWLKDLPFLDKDGCFDANEFYKLSPQPYIKGAFLNSCLNAELYYKGLIENGIKPQETREILPLATKSEIIMTGFESDWKHFFKLRCDKAAHPDMQIIANKAKEIIGIVSLSLSIVYLPISSPIKL